MGRVCKRGHKVTGTNALKKTVNGQDYTACRLCKNLAEVNRRKFHKEREARLLAREGLSYSSNNHRHVILNAI